VNEEVVAVFIPIVAIIMSLSIPIVYAIVDYRRRRDIIDANHKERMAAIRPRHGAPAAARVVLPVPEAGAPVELPVAGLVWLFVGIGLFIALGAVAGEEVRNFGLIRLAWAWRC